MMPVGQIVRTRDTESPALGVVALAISSRRTWSAIHGCALDIKGADGGAAPHAHQDDAVGRDGITPSRHGRPWAGHLLKFWHDRECRAGRRPPMLEMAGSRPAMTDGW